MICYTIHVYNYIYKQQSFVTLTLHLGVCKSSYCDEYKCVREPGEEVVLKTVNNGPRAIYSQNLENHLKMQEDGNIVLYCFGAVEWKTDTGILDGNFHESGLVLHKNGHLHNLSGEIKVYDSGVHVEARMVLFVMDSCDLVLCADKLVVWESRLRADSTSNCKCMIPTLKLPHVMCPFAHTYNYIARANFKFYRDSPKINFKISYSF